MKITYKLSLYHFITDQNFINCNHKKRFGKGNLPSDSDKGY
jgi:hypothetical protein